MSESLHQEQSAFSFHHPPCRGCGPASRRCGWSQCRSAPWKMFTWVQHRPGECQPSKLQLESLQSLSLVLYLNISDIFSVLILSLGLVKMPFSEYIILSLGHKHPVTVPIPTPVCSRELRRVNEHGSPCCPACVGCSAILGFFLQTPAS